MVPTDIKISELTNPQHLNKYSKSILYYMICLHSKSIIYKMVSYYSKNSNAN